MLYANSGTDLETVFASLKPQGVDALLVTTSPFFEGRRTELATLAVSIVLYRTRGRRIDMAVTFTAQANPRG